MLGVKTAALPASLRRTNQRTVVSLLLRLQSASRADLAKAAGISQPTAGKITSELLEMGIVEEAGLDVADLSSEAAVPRIGRPGQLIRLESHKARFIAIELGVAETSVSALPVAAKFQDDWDLTFATPPTPEAWVAKLKAVAKEISARHCWGVLVSVPGIVDETAGKSLFCPNLHWLETVDLPGLIGEVWDMPVVLIQEIRALALGHLASRPDGEDFFLVDFGQGVGGAIVLDGVLYSHPMPLSGEFGHTPVRGNARACGCGGTGCLETLMSQRGLLETFAAAERLSSPAWPQLVRHIAENGLQPWLAESLDAAGRIIAGALNVMGIHRVVITGILNDLPPFVVGHLTDEIRKGAMWARFGEVTCVTAPHQRAAGLVAAGIDRLVLPDEENGRHTAPPKYKALAAKL